MIRKFIALAIASGLAAQALRMWIDRQKSTNSEKAASPVAPPDMQRWENEGGNPAPAQTPTQ